MEKIKIDDTKTYLARFDQILIQMEDKMLSAKPTNSITKYFIECMIPHHQAAIYMCENLLKYTHYEPLIKISNNIIKMQTIGIRQMTNIYRTTTGFNNTQSDIEQYTKRYLAITKNMISKMKNSPRYLDINLDFVNEMIPHHEGAIQMCHNLLQYRIDPRLKNVAQNIIKEQSQGIKEMNAVKEMI